MHDQLPLTRFHPTSGGKLHMGSNLLLEKVLWHPNGLSWERTTGQIMGALNQAQMHPCNRDTHQQRLLKGNPGNPHCRPARGKELAIQGGIESVDWMPAFGTH